MRIIYVMILIGMVAFISCEKDKSEDLAPEKDSYRVKTISGSNAWWNSFSIALEYEKDGVLKTSPIVNGQDTIGQLMASKGGNTTSMYVTEFTPFEYEGEIDTVENVYYSIVSTSNNGRVTEEVISRSIPRPVIDPDDEFWFWFIRTRNDKYIYEYDDNGVLKYCRQLVTIYGTDPANSYEANYLDIKYFIYKNHYVYNGDILREVERYTADKYVEGSNYRLLGKYDYRYDAGKLLSVSGVDANRLLEYSESQLTYTNNGVATKYEYDANGNVVKITDAQGRVTNITYEKGKGNFETLVPFYERLMGYPAIK